MPGDTTLDQWDEHNTTAAPPNDDTTSSGMFLARYIFVSGQMAQIYLSTAKATITSP